MALLLAGRNLEANPRPSRSQSPGPRGRAPERRGSASDPHQVPGSTAPPRVGLYFGRQAWDEAAIGYILDRHAVSTNNSYKSQWRWWTLFCKRRQVEPYRGVTTGNSQVEERLFMDFMTFCCALGRWELRQRGCPGAS